jgi:hypothetical protein
MLCLRGPDAWIREMYRFGAQTFGLAIDPPSSTWVGRLSAARFPCSANPVSPRRINVQMREPAGTEAGVEPGQRPPDGVGAPQEITIDDPESLASALILTQSEIEDLRDPFTERFVDIQRSGVGRADVFMHADDSQELFE